MQERRDADRIVSHGSSQLAGGATSRRGLVYLLKGGDFPAVLCELTIDRAAVLANGAGQEGHNGRSSNTSRRLCATAPVERINSCNQPDGRPFAWWGWCRRRLCRLSALVATSSSALAAINGAVFVSIGAGGSANDIGQLDNKAPIGRINEKKTNQ